MIPVLVAALYFFIMTLFPVDEVVIRCNVRTVDGDRGTFRTTGT